MKHFTNQLIRISVIAVVLLLLLLIPYDVLFNSENSICIHYRLLGFECPLCGMTRAVYQFLHFHFVSAVHYNAVVIFLPVYLITDVFLLFKKLEILVLVQKILLWMLLVSLLMLYLFRMASFFNWI